MAPSQLIFIGKARSIKWLGGLYITSCVFLTDKPSLTSLLTKTLNYCPCLLWQPRFFHCPFFAVLFPLASSQGRWMTGAPMTNVRGITSLAGLFSHWLPTYECLMRPVWLDLGIFSPSIQSGGQLGVAQSLQSRAHRASGHDLLACIKDVACN